MKNKIQSIKRLGNIVLVLMNAAIAHNIKKFKDDIPIGKFCTTSLIMPAINTSP